MAKNSIRDYSATASSNTDIQSIDIDENCAASGINNAIREVMADIKDVSTGAVALESPAADSLTVTGDLTVDTNTLHVDSTNNNVGIGLTTSIDRKLHVEVDNDYAAKFGGTAGGDFAIEIGQTGTNGSPGFNATGTGGAMKFSIAGSEAMRIDSSNNLLVGKTSAGESIAGFEFKDDAEALFTRDDGRVLHLNRTTSDGEILRFENDGSLTGVIGASSTNDFYIGRSDTGLLFDNSDFILPYHPSTNATRDNVIDLGQSNVRFDNIYATNGSIQTSDQNEKQQIASLTSAEITAAKAISQLFKTFKWNSAVEAKGDAARTHTGVIAQQVETAMTDAGLDAGDYAFYISSTWWETSTDIPAVAAVSEVLDDDGNVITEAVEAKDAYTRIDTYDTQADAPVGATERTRKGIRYAELLSFIGAATEQRLADVEARITALETA